MLHEGSFTAYIVELFSCKKLGDLASILALRKSGAGEEGTELAVAFQERFTALVAGLVCYLGGLLGFLFYIFTVRVI